jgi:hypothetical protein
MRLPNVETAGISEAKIVRYLLSTTHRAGKSKAAFFMQFGFTPERWEDLADALRQHALDNEITIEERTIFVGSSRRKLAKCPQPMVYR